MNIGTKLLNLRKSKQLSQEEVADKLNVTRQTISKWETDQSTPDFDKIIPICELYGISADELLKENESKEVNEEKTSLEEVDDTNIRKKRARGISMGVLVYFIAVAWIMISIPVLMINPIVSSAIFLLLCGLGTYMIVYACIFNKCKRIEKPKKEKTLTNQINTIISIIILVIYLWISFTTMAWHITWILWVVYALIAEIVKLIFMLRGE